jgi:ABC-type nickel/cobalt efflux system permease component RcnA
LLKRGLLIGLIAGLCAPVVATVLTMLLFNMPSGSSADAYWTAIGVLSPGYALINSVGTFTLISILDGVLYAMIGVAVAATVCTIQRFVE